jgi:hypothetical protein
MGRKFAGGRRAAATGIAVLAAGLAGCGGPAGPTTAPGPSGTVTQAADGAPAGELAHSHLRVLTRLGRRQLCGALSPAQARKILGARPETPVYTVERDQGISCQWLQRGARRAGTRGWVTGQLYVGISAVVSWQGAQLVDNKLPQHRRVTIDGHPADAAAAQGAMIWSQVDVALGGTDDPVADYRAATLAQALRMATTATPHLLAMG